MIKAIETVYKGYRFRSRLEARWAVFFDTLGVKWEYEKEGFDLGDAGWYLPDFWLPQQQVWVEIKGNDPSDDERRKCFLLADGLTYPVVMFWGSMGYDDLELGRPEFQGKVFLGFHPPNPKYFPWQKHLWDHIFGTGDNNLENFLQRIGYTIDHSLNGKDRIIHLHEIANKYSFEECGKPYHLGQFGISFYASPMLKNGVLIFDDDDRGESVRFAINAACSARFEHKRCNTRY